ncbi:hypothetical protein RRF57_002438 [Xylaria bambusicola]|uniref:ABC transporter domain-containing protein n=1 Tax=Xylaria bambusicola TaxID=326684 RepID=A0AAN7Z4H5_9PEZI
MAVLAAIIAIILAYYWSSTRGSGSQDEAPFLVALLASALAALGLSALLFLEQQRSHKASDLAVLYLCASILCDVLYLTMPAKPTSNLRPVVARCTVNSVLLVWECFIKRSAFRDVGSRLLPEDMRSVLSRMLFIWINPILSRGYRNMLLPQDVPPLSDDMKSEYTRTTMLQAWSQRTKYQHSLNRLKLMTRTALVGIIYNKTLELPSIAYDTGEATTLMSTDTDGLETIAEMVHEIWAQVLEVLIGIGLLADQIGWIWPLPLFLIYCQYTYVLTRFEQLLSHVVSSHMSRFVAKHLQPRQKAWNVATQDRIAATSDMLASIKIIKMLGFQYDITRRIQTLRNTELYKASGLRLVMLYYGITVISHASDRTLQTETAFTTMAILSMITNPANMVMTIVPRTIAAFSGFERIQAFLLQQPLQTYRGTLLRGNTHPVVWDPSSGRLIGPGPVIQIRDVAIGSKGVPLKNINIELAARSFTILSGPTGSGKSSLLRSLIGEILPAHGSISLSSNRVAYCAQRPWLPNGTIRNAIRGFANVNDPISPWSQQWYDKVIEICCLTQDLAALYNGDQTQIGSRGLNLSGGQRQRVLINAPEALARALFARCDILLLDDTFSGLDGDTERTIFDNLFKPTGLLRQQKTTVILVSNSSDHVVVLGNNGIIEQGPWQTIKLKTQTLAKFSATSHQVIEDTKLVGRYDALDAQIRVKEETEADLSRQTGDPAIYGYYLRFIGLVNILALAIFTGSYSLFITFPQYWLQLWTERKYDQSDSFYIIGFLFLSLMSWLSTSGQMWFTQDIQLIDKQLPTAFVTLVTQKWLGLSLPACVAVVYVIQKVYLRTSRQLRFLELEARAGVFSSFLETIEGLETIRTFGWSGDVTRENILKVDDSSRPEFLLLCLQRWLNIVLDLVAAAIATTIVVIAVAFKGHISGAEIGVALNTMLVTNTTLLRLVENWALLETSLGAIARVKTLENMTPFEGGRVPGLDPAPDWPQRGHIHLKNITAAYHGKSTLLLTLLRMLELRSGNIEIDGFNIKHVSLEVLRQRCFITVSQDPLLLLHETVRFNLDPSASIPNDVLMETLRKCELSSHLSGGNTTDSTVGRNSFEQADIDKFEGPNGEHPILDQKLLEFSELSVGQCQLFALSRALVKAIVLERHGIKPIVLLDEATSSLDSVTEATIYRIIDEEFSSKGHTVVIVAHRVGVLEKHMKKGRDAVAVMGDGKLQDVSLNWERATLA